MESLIIQVTLLVIATVSNIALLFNWLSNRNIPGLKLISIGFLIMSPGIALLAVSGTISLSVTIIFAATTIFTGQIIILIGVTEFWNQERSRLPIVCICFFGATIISFTFSLASGDVEALWPARFFAAAQMAYYLSSIFVLQRGLRIERRIRPAMVASSHWGVYLATGMFSTNILTNIMMVYLRTSNIDISAETFGGLQQLISFTTLSVFAFAIIIMSMEELSAEHKEDAVYDPVTTILNHRTFIEVGQRVLGVALRYSQPVSMLTIELENMDQIVRNHGYKIANQVLFQFAQLITDRRRNEDVLARCGFKEFRMLLPGIDEAGSNIVMQKIQSEIAVHDVVIEGNKLNLKLNIVSVTCKEEDLHLQQMMQEGDVELFRLKEGMAPGAGGKPENPLV